MKSGRNEKKITKVCRSDSELRREERDGRLTYAPLTPQDTCRGRSLRWASGNLPAHYRWFPVRRARGMVGTSSGTRAVQTKRRVRPTHATSIMMLWSILISYFKLVVRVVKR